MEKSVIKRNMIVTEKTNHGPVETDSNLKSRM